MQWFHTKTGTFHLSYGEYAVLPVNWTTILGLRFSGYPVPIAFVDFDITSELLGNHYPFTWVTRQYLGPTDEPHIHMEWLRASIPLGAKPDDIPFKQFFFYFIGSCLFGNNRSVLTYQLLSTIRVVSNIEAYD